MINNSNEGTSSLLEKVQNPVFRNYSRTSYHIDVEFMIDGKNTTVPMKIDTGATRTVVGTGILEIKSFRKKIINSHKRNMIIKNASSDDVIIYSYVVKQFRISKEIVLPAVEIWFSDELKEKAVLGMDILSLFDFRYQLDKKGSNGEFWINDYQAAIERITTCGFYKNNNYIQSGMILTLDDAPQSSKEKSQLSTKKGKYTKEDLQANYMNKRIKEEKSRQ